MPPAIHTATTSDEERIVAVLVLAFSRDPAVRWAFPEPSRYLTYFPRFVRAFGGRAFEHGSAHYADGYVGAALWLPPDVHPDEDAMGTVFQEGAAEQAQEDVFALLEQMASYHPSEPHWYLPLIGVDPTRQGNGYGSALLQHATALCDRDGRLAYLESSNPANVPLYERHGFEVVGTIQAGSSPPFWPMVRKPH
ncbi:MAG TPA: GNAT family N-acetyltransferase [Chloroflexota bacterium]|nr:GNAT family N-acetyltransferase [Chloroflexota bacterium]